MEDGHIHTEGISQNCQLWKIHFSILSTHFHNLCCPLLRDLPQVIFHIIFMHFGLTFFFPFSDKQHLSHPLFNRVGVHYLLIFQYSAVPYPPVEGLNPPIIHTTHVFISSCTVSWINLIPLLRKPGPRREQFALRPTKAQIVSPLELDTVDLKCKGNSH